MSFKKFALMTLVAASAFAASPANASYAGFHFLYNQDNNNNTQDNNHNSGGTDNHSSDNHNGDACQGWNCQPDDPQSHDSNSNWDDQSSAGGFQAVSVDTPVSGVPEPATWAMFLLGFGGIGFMLRSARRKQAGVRGAA